MHACMLAHVRHRYPWTDDEIDAAADQGRGVHWLATTGRVPAKTAHHMGPRRRVPYKRHAEALNTQVMHLAPNTSEVIFSLRA